MANADQINQNLDPASPMQSLNRKQQVVNGFDSIQPRRWVSALSVTLSCHCVVVHFNVVAILFIGCFHLNKFDNIGWHSETVEMHAYIHHVGTRAGHSSGRHTRINKQNHP